jgi:predicted nucleic acid-binding protein
MSEAIDIYVLDTFAWLTLIEDEAGADSVQELLIDSTEALGILAGELKAKYRLSVADTWIVVLAKERNATLVHKDPEFEQVESAIKVLQLPYKASV